LPTVWVSDTEPASDAEPRSLAGSAPTSADVASRCGETADAWTVTEVWQSVLQNHPSVRLWQREAEVARAELLTARLLPNPELVITADPEMGNSDRTAMTSRLMFTVPWGPKRRLRTAAAVNRPATAQCRPTRSPTCWTPSPACG